MLLTIPFSKWGVLREIFLASNTSGKSQREIDKGHHTDFKPIFPNLKLISPLIIRVAAAHLFKKDTPGRLRISV